MAPMLPKRLSPLVAALVGAILFLAMIAATELLARAGLDSTAQQHTAIKVIMLLASLGLIVGIGRPWHTWGLAAPRSWLRSTLLPTLFGGAIGATATATILGFRLPPMAGVSELGLLRLVLIIWFGSTLAEEVFVRGLIQGWMQPMDEQDAKAGSVSMRILASGLLFGAMHLSVFFAGSDPRTAWVIVVATTLLGLTCAWSRERSGSLIGPLTAHLAFNVCGLIGGIAVLVARAISER